VSSSKFHLSLNVCDLPGTAAFLELLLGVKPAQLHSDYAKFELSDPALVLSLVPTDVPVGAGLNHVGFRLPSRQSLFALQERLETAGVAHQSEESIACCHSRQTKFWVHDPAGNLWELYVLDEAGECAAEVVALTPRVARKPTSTMLPKSWSHRLGEPIPRHIPAEDSALDQVVLEGTINAEQADFQKSMILQEASRVLRPGGKLLVRGVTADRPLNQLPDLPGPAAAVKHVPIAHEVLAAVHWAGFVDLELLTFGETYCFSHAGAELRETRLQAFRAAPETDSRGLVVVYRGPFTQVEDDSGLTFSRGARVSVNEHTWHRLQDSTCASQFVFLEGAKSTLAPSSSDQI
jgi:extradiol dioxygenase family protein